MLAMLIFSATGRKCRTMLVLANAHVTSEYAQKSQEKWPLVSQQPIPEKATRPNLLSMQDR
jgi:hypothetical protein